MNQLIPDCIISATTALLLCLMIVPVLMRFSARLGLMDKPGFRKVHASAVPVVGGIAIVLASGMALMLSSISLELVKQYPVLLGGSLLLFIIGVWDDRKHLSPMYRLMIQILCATAVAANGIRLSSMHGLLGINEIPVFVQYFLTIIIITGVTNAFNLIDGIDGLAGGLAFINLTILGILSFMLKQYALMVLFVTLTGAITGFLKNNIHPAKIFMGDGGSLFLGFLMSSAGILLIETTKTIHTIDASYVVLLVASILLIPVFDSLRVYMWRMQRGNSPFKADKTHLHHLFLTLGLNHKKTASFIYVLELAILIIGILLLRWAGISASIMIIVILFLFISQLLQLNYSVDKWNKVIRKMEKSD